MDRSRYGQEKAVPSEPFVEILERYFTELDAGRASECAALFAKDAVYIRPQLPNMPGPQTGELAVIEGRANIYEWLVGRGKRDSHHTIVFSALDDTSIFVEGRGRGGNLPDLAFLAHVTIDDAGLITRYLALSSPSDASRVVDSSASVARAEQERLPKD